MPGKLKPLDVERETWSGKYPDGDGLYLVVASPTSKNWSYRDWKDGKQRWLGLRSVRRSVDGRGLVREHTPDAGPFSG